MLAPSPSTTITDGTEDHVNDAQVYRPHDTSRGPKLIERREKKKEEEKKEQNCRRATAIDFYIVLWLFFVLHP
ncbi:hypothetical protein JHK87_000910 [Glycine soja]|nr:hypothetical protein JHK87_000910 [Glycine soja]